MKVNLPLLGGQLAVNGPHVARTDTCLFSKVGDNPHYLTPPCLLSCMAFVSVYLWVVGWSGGNSNDLNGNALDEEHQPKNRSNLNDNMNVIVRPAKG
ncbi:hypothetical protein V1478_000515 [Vespula squamosa]|uniref:Uncharacterized protein n=1 Tax=Vespula squamosa TaxID=30214 RepID=A0ABD2C5U2_VESSQ